MSNGSARIYVAIGLIASFVLSGCASHGPQPETARPVAVVPSEVIAEDPGQTLLLSARAVAVALDQVGVPYRYGGADRRGFDCSGLVHFAYGKVGLSMPRTTGELWKRLSPVQPAALQQGDILFFDIEGKVSHVGLYLGDGRFVHAPSSGRSVTVARLDWPFYRQALVRGGRP